MDEIRQIRSRADTAIQAVIKDKSVSCRAGCSACCKQLIYMTLAEAADIVDRYPEKVAALRPKLQEQSNRLMRNSDNFAVFGMPCAFLDNDKCTIYPHRPFVCRGHYVASPPELCTIPDAKVQAHDTRAIVQLALGEAMASGAQPHSLVPIPMAMLLALDATAGGDGG